MNINWVINFQFYFSILQLLKMNVKYDNVCLSVFRYFHYFLEFTLIIELHTTLLSQEEKKNNKQRISRFQFTKNAYENIVFAV